MDKKLKIISYYSFNFQQRLFELIEYMNRKSSIDKKWSRDAQQTPLMPALCVSSIDRNTIHNIIFFFVELTYFVHIDGLLYDKPRWVILSTGLKWCSILPNSECIYLPQKTKKDTYRDPNDAPRDPIGLKRNQKGHYLTL